MTSKSRGHIDRRKSDFDVLERVIGGVHPDYFPRYDADDRPVRKPRSKRLSSGERPDKPGRETD
jgi:hypothetical protein